MISFNRKEKNVEVFDVLFFFVLIISENTLEKSFDLSNSLLREF